MSIVIETFLVCDKCGTNFGIDSRHYKGTQHRKDASAEGWTYGDNKDQCPECRPKRKDGEPHSKKNRTKKINS